MMEKVNIMSSFKKPSITQLQNSYVSLSSPPPPPPPPL
jgi:hypothetical protein